MTICVSETIAFFFLYIFQKIKKALLKQLVYGTHFTLHSQYQLISMRRQSILVGPLTKVRSTKIAVRPALPSRVSKRLGYGQVLLHVVDGSVQLAERPVG